MFNLWGARDGARTECTACSLHFDNVFVDDDDGARLCRRCYERLTYSHRVRFWPSFGRWPSVADFSLSSVCSLYGATTVYCIVWALRKWLPLALVRTIVEAPIRRVETPSYRFTHFFGKYRGPWIRIINDNEWKYRMYGEVEETIHWEKTHDCQRVTISEYVNTIGRRLDGLAIRTERRGDDTASAPISTRSAHEYILGKRVLERRMDGTTFVRSLFTYNRL